MPPFPDFADEPTQPVTAVAHPADDVEDDLLEEGWEQPRRTSRLTLVLGAALLVGLGFAGGALVGHSAGAGASGALGSCQLPDGGAVPGGGGAPGAGAGQGAPG